MDKKWTGVLARLPLNWDLSGTTRKSFREEIPEDESDEDREAEQRSFDLPPDMRTTAHLTEKHVPAGLVPAGITLVSHLYLCTI